MQWFFFCQQTVNTDHHSLEFSPTFEELIEEVDGLIDYLVQGCEGIKRIEEHLFQQQEGVEIKEICVMQIDEQPVNDAKSRIEDVIRKNISGPEQ